MACDCILLNITKQEIFLTYSKVSKLFHIEHLRNFSETPQFHYFKIILSSQILENNPTIRHTITIKKKNSFCIKHVITFNNKQARKTHELHNRTARGK